MTPVNSEAESSKEYSDLKSLSNQNQDLNEVTSISPELRFIVAKTIAGHLVHLKSLTTSCTEVISEKTLKNFRDSPTDNMEDFEQHYPNDPFMYNLSPEDSKTVQMSSRKFSDRSEYRKMMSAKDFRESKNKTVTSVNSTMENPDFNTENQDDLEELNSIICSRIFEGLRGNIVVKNVQINEHSTGLTIRHMVDSEARNDSERLLFVLFSDKLHETLKALQSVEVDFEEGDLKKSKASYFHIPELIKPEMIGSHCKEVFSKLLSDTLQTILENFPGVEKEEDDEMFEVESHDSYTLKKDGDWKKSSEFTNVSIIYRLHQFPAIKNINIDEAIYAKNNYRRHRSVDLDTGDSEDVQNNNSTRLLLIPTDNSKQTTQKIVGIDVSIADGYIEKKKFSFITGKNDDLKSYREKASDSSTINFVPTVTDTKINVQVDKLKRRQLSTTVTEVTSDSSIEEYELKDAFSRILAQGLQMFSLLNAKNNKVVLSNTSKQGPYGINSQTDKDSEKYEAGDSKVFPLKTFPYNHSIRRNSDNFQNFSKMPEMYDSKDGFSRILAQGILIFSQVNAKNIPSNTSKEKQDEINNQKDRESEGLDVDDANMKRYNTFKEFVTNRKKRDTKTGFVTNRKKSETETEFITNTKKTDTETEFVVSPNKKANEPVSMIHVMLPFPDHIITTSELSYMKNRKARSGDLEELRSNLTTGAEADETDEEERLAGIKKPLLKIPKLMLKKLSALKKYSNRPSVPILPFFFNSTIWQDIKERLAILGERVSTTADSGQNGSVN